jgi:hypothetical protein
VLNKPSTARGRLGLRVQSTGFRVWGIGIRVKGIAFRVKGIAFGIWGCNSADNTRALRDHGVGSGFRISDLGLGFLGLGF